MKKDITGLFCLVDDFVKSYNQELAKHQIGKQRQPTRVTRLSESEIITIILLFQQSPCKNFKFFYQLYLPLYQKEFPSLVSYPRFVALMPRALMGLCLLLHFSCVSSQGVSYIDSSSLAVCHPKRISRNKVFKGIAALGKTTKGFFFGLKLHLIVTSQGDIVSCKLTPGNVDDRKPVPTLVKKLKGLLFGDKGYIGAKLFQELYQQGIKLVTGIKKTMKNKLININEKILLRKRSIIETVFDYLKNKLSIEHTRHRSPCNALIHILSTLLTYQLKPSKPSISYNLAITNP